MLGRGRDDFGVLNADQPVSSANLRACRSRDRFESQPVQPIDRLINEVQSIRGVALSESARTQPPLKDSDGRHVQQPGDHRSLEYTIAAMQPH